MGASLTGGDPNPIMPPSRITFRCKERLHVIHVSTAFKSKEKARARVSKAHEHQEWPEGLGSAPSQRTSPPDRVEQCCKAPSTALSPCFLPPISKFLTDADEAGLSLLASDGVDGEAWRESSS